MKNVKIFISSTFKDMNAERDVIMKNVMPRLRERAEKELGLYVQEVDLRWGVTEEQARRGEVETLCIEGIEECRPYFLCMLGGRYGWIPVPVNLRVGDYNAVMENAALSEDEKNLVKGYYHKTNDEQRVYTIDPRLAEIDRKEATELQERLQQTLEKAGVEGAGESITHKEINYSGLKEELPRFIKDLDKRLIALPEDRKLTNDENAFLRSLYIRSTGDPIWRLLSGVTGEEKVRMLPVLQKAGISIGMHRFYFIRNDKAKGFYYIAGKRDTSIYTDPSARSEEKLIALKRKINESNKYELYKEYNCVWNEDNYGKEDQGIYPVTNLDEFEEIVFNAIWRHIQDNLELRRHEVEVKNDVAQELDFHYCYIDSRTYSFCGRQELLFNIESAVQRALLGKLEVESSLNNEKIPTQHVMVLGEPGSGKSALLGKFYLDYKTIHPDHLAIPWFVGASRQSANPYYILKYWCKILIQEFHITEVEITYDHDRLYMLFETCIKKADRPVVIVLDAINQLQKTEIAHTMQWLMPKLPQNVCVVTSLVETSSEKPAKMVEEEDILVSMRNRIPRPFEIHVHKLAEEDKRDIISTYLRQFYKSLSPEMVEFLVNKPESHNPLYLSIALEELRLFSRHDELKAFIANTNPYKPGLPDTSEEMFAFLLSRIEQDLQRRHGNNVSVLFADFMRYIAAGRNGMSEEDLRLLLGDWKIIKERGKENVMLNDYLWSELRRWVRSYLIQREEEYDFFHLQLKLAVGKKYLPSNESKADIHSTISDYLMVMGYKHKTTLKDLPHHCAKADKWNRVMDILSDFTFLEEKTLFLSVYDLINDFCIPERTPQNMDDKKWDTYNKIRDVLLIEAPNIAAHPASFVQQLYNALYLQGNNELQILCNKAMEKHIQQHPDNVLFITRYRPSISLKEIHKGIFESPETNMDAIVGMEIDSDNEYLYSISSDRALRKWSLHTGKCIAIYDTPAAAGFTSLSVVNPNCIVVGRTDGSIVLFDSVNTTYERIKISDNRIQAVAAIDEKAIGVMVQGGDLYVLSNLKSGGYSQKLACKCGATVNVKYSKEEKLFSVITAAGEIHFIDPGMEIPVRTVSIGFPVVKGDIENKKQLAIVTNPSGEIIVFSIREQKIIARCEGIGSSTCVAFSPSGGKVAVANQIYQILVYQSGNLQKTCSINGHHGPINSMVWENDDKTLFSGSADKTIRHSEVMQIDPYVTPEHLFSVYACIILDRKGWAISGSINSEIWSWNLETGIRSTIFTGHESSIRDMVLDPHSKDRFITASADGTLMLWSMVNNKPVRKFTGHNIRVLCCDISFDGKTLLSGDGNGLVIKWNMETGEPLKTWKLHSNAVMNIRFNKDGTLFVSAGYDQVASAWSATTGTNVRSFRHYSIVNAALFLDDGCVATASNDSDIRIWDMQSQEQPIVFEGHKSPVNDMQLSPNGKYLFSVSDDRSMRCWCLETHKPVGIFYNQSSIRSLFVDQTGLVAMGDMAGKLHVLDVKGNSEIFGSKESEHISTLQKIEQMRIEELINQINEDDPIGKVITSLAIVSDEIAASLKSGKITSWQNHEFQDVFNKIRAHFKIEDTTQ